MRAAEVVHKWIGSRLSAVLDVRLVRRVVNAAEALVTGRRLILMELARQSPGARRVAVPLKALDRLLSNTSVHAAMSDIYRATLERLWPVAQPWIIVDSCTLDRT